MDQRYRIVTLPRAATDLEDIVDFIEPTSPQNAELVAMRLIAAIDSLEVNASMYKVYKSNRRPNLVVHAVTARPFIIYYRIVESDAVVEVLTIRHGASRQPERF